jgi:hypothetical protein
MIGDGFPAYALDDSGRDVEVPNDLTEETTMQPSALAMAVGALCRPGGLTHENQRRVEEAILAPRRPSIAQPGRYRLTADVVTRNLTATATLPAGTEIDVTQVDPASGKVIGYPLLDWTRWDLPVVPVLSPEAERQQAIRLAREALAQAERRVMECEVALYEAEGRGDAPYARMRRAQLDGDAAADRAASIEFWADAHEQNGTHPPPSLADAVTTLIAKRRMEREQH